MFCTSCGEALLQGAHYCGRCGVGVHQTDEIAPATHKKFQTEELFIGSPRQYFEAHPQVVDKPRPWVRYFARMADIWFWGIIIGLILGFSLPEWVSKTGDIVIGLVVLLIMIPVQAIVFTIFWNSIGKSLLGVKVIHRGKSLNFSYNLQREFLVYVKGIGFGIPVVSFVTMLIGYDKLSKNKITSWDKENSFDVTHRDPSLGGVLGVIAIFIVMLILNVIGSTQNY